MDIGEIIYLSQLLQPLYRVTRKKYEFIWGPEQQMAFKITKAALQQALDLWPIIDDPVELIVGVEQGIANWSLWQQQGKNRVPLGFWSRKLPVTQKIYTPFEQQLLAAYWALTETEHLTLNLIVYLRPKIPIMSWISSDPVSHKIGHAQEYSIIKWK